MTEMKRIQNWKTKADCLGRTLEEKGKVFIGWTNAGLRFSFTGTCLIADLDALCEIERQWDEVNHNEGSGRVLWPYMAVFYDDRQQPDIMFEVKRPQNTYLLFASDKEETHTITLRKISENTTGKIICNGFLGEGIIESARQQARQLQIEFIGDSITCGFGNMTEERDRIFYADEENGWMSHGAMAGRILNAEIQMVCCSGITLAELLKKDMWELPAMSKIYQYTDWFMEKKQNRMTHTEWEFASHFKDVVVINLGTNDSTMIDMFQDISLGIRKFEETYYKFLHLLREKNGEDTWIICTLGPLDYFLYDSIEKAVKRFVIERNDKKIRCFKYMKTRIGEGFGACSHPSLRTQERMGMEIADYIQKLINETDER